jgi:uncharacterized membrane protein
MEIYLFAILGYIVLFLTLIVMVRSIFNYFRKKTTSSDSKND